MSDSVPTPGTLGAGGLLRDPRHIRGDLKLIGQAVADPEWKLPEESLIRFGSIANTLNGWDTLVHSEEVKEAESSHALLSLELRSEEHANLSTVSKAITNIEELYESIAKLHGVKDPAPLEVLRVESGSNIRIELKGLPKVVGPVLKFLTETWHDLRFGKQRTAMATAEAMTVINRKIKNGDLSEEEGGILKQKMIGNASDLITDGVLPADIPATELIDNVKLLTDQMPKRITGPEPTGEKQPKTKKKAAPKKKAASKKKPFKKKATPKKKPSQK